MQITLQWDESFDIGPDIGTPVDDQDYEVPFKFTGKIDKLTTAVDPPRLTPQDMKKLEAASRRPGRELSVAFLTLRGKWVIDITIRLGQAAIAQLRNCDAHARSISF
jgi:hypothetical protein